MHRHIGWKLLGAFTRVPYRTITAVAAAIAMTGIVYSASAVAHAAPGSCVEHSSDLATAVASSGTVTLCKDLTVEHPVTVTSGRTVTIDLNGHALDVHTVADGANEVSGIVNDGTLFIIDGTLTVTGGDGADGTSGIANSGMLFIGAGGAAKGGNNGTEGAGIGLHILRPGVVISPDTFTTDRGNTEVGDGAGWYGGLGISGSGAVRLYAHPDAAEPVIVTLRTADGEITTSALSATLDAISPFWPLLSGMQVDHWSTGWDSDGGESWTLSPSVSRTVRGSPSPNPTFTAAWSSAAPSSETSPTPSTVSRPADSVVGPTATTSPTRLLDARPTQELGTKSQVPDHSGESATDTSKLSPFVPLPPNADSADLTVSSHDLTAEDQLTITATGFQPGSHVDFWIHSTPRFLGAAVADATGVAVLRVTIDKDLLGTHTVQAIGIGPDGQLHNLGQTVNIRQPQLAVTGANFSTATLLAAIAVLAGLGLVVFSRRKTVPGQHQ